MTSPSIVLEDQMMINEGEKMMIESGKSSAVQNVESVSDECNIEKRTRWCTYEDFAKRFEHRQNLTDE